MSGVISLVAFIAVVTVVSFVAYYLIYNKRINDKLKNNESTAHNSMVPVDTMGRFFAIFFVVAIIFIMFSELNGLKTDIEAQTEIFGSKAACLEEKISELEDKMNQQNSLLNSFQCTVGEIDTIDRTVELKFECSPKVYSKDTKLTLINGDRKIKFTYDDGKYRATAVFSIFERFEEESIILQEDDGVYRTSYEMGIMPAYLANDCLPQLGEGMSIECNNMGKKVEISGNVVLGDADKFSNIELYVLRNGEKIKEISDLNSEGGQSSFDVKVDVGDDDSVLVVLSGTDEYGFTHKKILVGVNFDDDMMDGYASIYDSDGNLLSGVEIE